MCLSAIPGAKNDDSIRGGCADSGVGGGASLPLFPSSFLPLLFSPLSSSGLRRRLRRQLSRKRAAPAKVGIFWGKDAHFLES